MPDSRRLLIIESRRQFRVDDGPLVGPLTNHLWTLLIALCDGALWPTERIAIEVWPSPNGDMTVTLNSVYTAISILRRRANNAGFIKSHHRAGYMLDVDTIEYAA